MEKVMYFIDINMPKPNRLSNVKELKDYVRKHNLNTFGNKLKLSMKKAELQDRLRDLGHWDNQYDHSSKEVRGSRAATKRDYKKRGELIKGPKKRPKLPKRAPKDLRRAKLKAGGKGTRAPITSKSQAARLKLVHGNGTHGAYNPAAMQARL
jgi:hypothetical protein